MRTKSTNTAQFHITATPEWRAMLRELAWQARCSQADFIRQAVAEKIARDGFDVELVDN